MHSCEIVCIKFFVCIQGLDMIEAGGTFGPDGSYGAALIKTGKLFAVSQSIRVTEFHLNFSPFIFIRSNRTETRSS